MSAVQNPDATIEPPATNAVPLHQNKKQKLSSEAVPNEPRATGLDDDFRPCLECVGPACNHHMLQTKLGDLPAPDSLLDGVVFATAAEVAACSMANIKVVITGQMRGLTAVAADGSQAQKNEAKRRCIALGAKWQTAISGATTILVVGPRAHWKCAGGKTQKAKEYREKGKPIAFWTSRQLACFLEARMPPGATDTAANE